MPGPRRLLATAVALILLLQVPAAAFADQLSDKQAQAAAVQAQIAALDTKAEIATEGFNTARDHYARLTAEVAVTGKRIGVLQARTSKLQHALDTRAGQMYRDPLSFLEVLMGAHTFEEFATTFQLLTNISERDANTVAELERARQQAAEARAALKTAQAGAARQQAAMAADRASVLAGLAARKRTLAGLGSDIKTLIAQQQAAEAAASRQRLLALRAAAAQQAAAPVPDPSPAPAQTRSAPSGARSHSSPAPKPQPSGSTTGARAVWWAEQALGRPYEWAASGPDSFDCSGLTMWAYAHVGVSLPHSSAEQVGAGRRVARSDLQPGDLVFFGSPIHHVGMYVGGGDFIEAPYTGADVRISSLSRRSDYAGACRPY